MGQARSQPLIIWEADAAGFSPAFTCPAASVVLVKSAYFFNGGTAPIGVQLRLFDPAANTQIIFFVGDAQPNVPLEWSGWIVMQPGDTLLAYAAPPVVSVWVSGAVLNGSPQVPPAVRALPRVEPHG